MARWLLFVRFLFALSSSLISFSILADAYIQAGGSVYDSKHINVKSVAAEVGYSYKFIDVSAGIGQNWLTKGNHSIEWNGLSASAALHIPIISNASVFGAYQYSQLWNGDFQCKYGAGLALHLDPIKLALVYAPDQQNWPQFVGLVAKFRYSEKGFD